MTAVLYNFVKTLWDDPPVFLNFEINFPSARVAVFVDSLTVTDKSRYSSNQTPKYLYLSVLILDYHK